MILTTPTQMHARQGEQCMRAGKHVMIEIPMADNLADSERLVAVQKETGLVAMAGHTRRFNPSHQWIHKRIKKGELNIQQMDVQTYFFRRTNIECAGQAAELDGSSALASRLPHRRFVPVPDRARLRASLMQSKVRIHPDARHRNGHEHSVEGAVRRNLHSVAVIQQ